jgi:hypothetical protein
MAENIDIKNMLEALRARRDNLNAAIEGLERVLGEEPFTAQPSTSPAVRQQGRQAEIEHDTFVGMSVAEAAARYLGMVGRPARSLEEITNALNSGGLNSSQGTVQTLLSRSHNGPNPVVRRAGRGTWGLPEWYGN